MRIKGTIVYKDFEGGFWGIEGDDGASYRPVSGLPDALRREGQRVTADVEPVQMVSIAMWGRSVKVNEIEAL